MIDQSVQSAHFLSLSGSVNDARQTRPHFNAFLHFYSPVVVTLHSKLAASRAHQQQHQDSVHSPFMQGRCDELKTKEEETSKASLEEAGVEKTETWW